MKLRTKVTIILAILWVVMLITAFLGSQFIIKKSYLDLEAKEAKNNVQRIKEGILQVNSFVNTMTFNWAVWDDTYQFVIDGNESYKKTNLVLGSFVSADVDMMMYFNLSGKPVAVMAVNPERDKEIDFPKDFWGYLTPQSRLVHQAEIGKYTQGMVSLSSGILLVAAHPIVTSNNTGPVHGTLIMAKYLSQATLEKISSIVKIKFSIERIINNQVDPIFKPIYAELLKSGSHTLERNNGTEISGYGLLRDINGEPIAIIKATLPRELYQIGEKTIQYYNFAFFIYSLIVIALLWYLLQTLLVRRLEKLSEKIGGVDSNKDYFNNLVDEVPDEVTAVASLYHQATHDPLTGLANRNLLEQVFNNSLVRINLTKNKIALLFLDLDYFKRVNDFLGHEVGDALLIEMGKQLSTCLRESDLAVRLGGDEFVLLLIGVSSEQLSIVIDRIYNTLAKPVYIQGHELYLSSSMGISLYPTDGRDVSTLLKHADIALYHAKESGRNHFQYYSEALNQSILEAYKKESELQRAIDNNQLRLFYQPIYNVITQRVVSIEVLVRWLHPERGMLGAGEIIPLAEKTGLIVPIGKWVLAEACKVAATWRKQGILFAPLAVNLSILQLRNASIEKLVKTALDQSGLDPHLLELELTETGYIELSDSILTEMRSLRDMGINLVVDDFGIGYSGLGNLKRLPVSKLKIDQSFIKDLLTNPDDRAITLAIISIAHQLDLQVVAEGVETSEQYGFLKMSKIDAAQGYYLRKPMNFEECMEFLREHYKVFTPSDV